MRQRLPILIVCLLIGSALLVAGCGEDEASTTTAPEATSQTSSSSDSAGESAQRTLDSCIDAAERLPDETAAKKAKKQCQDAYGNIKEQTEKLDEATAEARENCKEAAEAIPDGQAKEDALAACEKFQ